MYPARRFPTHTTSRIVQRALFLCPPRSKVDRRHFFAICFGPECCLKTVLRHTHFRLQFIIVFFVVICNDSHCVVFTFSILISNNEVNYKIHETLCTQPQAGASISEALVFSLLSAKASNGKRLRSSNAATRAVVVHGPETPGPTYSRRINTHQIDLRTNRTRLRSSGNIFVVSGHLVSSVTMVSEPV